MEPEKIIGQRREMVTTQPRYRRSSMSTTMRNTLMPVGTYEGWNFNSGNYLFTTDTK